MYHDCSLAQVYNIKFLTFQTQEVEVTKLFQLCTQYQRSYCLQTQIPNGTDLESQAFSYIKGKKWN